MTSSDSPGRVVPFLEESRSCLLVTFVRHCLSFQGPPESRSSMPASANQGCGTISMSLTSLRTCAWIALQRVTLLQNGSFKSVTVATSLLTKPSSCLKQHVFMTTLYSLWSMPFIQSCKMAINQTSSSSTTPFFPQGMTRLIISTAPSLTSFQVSSPPTTVWTRSMRSLLIYTLLSFSTPLTHPACLWLTWISSWAALSCSCAI